MAARKLRDTITFADLHARHVTTVFLFDYHFRPYGGTRVLGLNR